MSRKKMPSPDSLSDQLIRRLAGSSTGINQSVSRIMSDPMHLGFRFEEIMRTVHDHYVALAGDSHETSRRAQSDAFAYIGRLHGFSSAKIRLHVNTYARFRNNADAIDYLRLTDMQLLLGPDIGDDIVSTVIEMRKDNPLMSAREVKNVITALRQKPPAISIDQTGGPA
jgi:hypothetical protein